MYSKRYRKASVREALKAAREDLGAHALVLSTDLVAVAGWRGWLGAREVQMTAAVDREVSESRPPRTGSRQADTDTDPIREGLVARLVASGVDPALALLVAKSIPDAECRGATIAGLRRALADLLGPMAAGVEDFARAEVFIGPPGVGKTTTIAKIAARERAGHGRALGMVAADGFRAGAVEQLRIYATIIGAPFKVARNAEELDKALSGARQPLLVDTAGRSPNDPAVRDLLQLVGKRRLVRTHLVMAADTSASSARRIFDAYEGAHPDRLVITKIDEAESLNPLLAVLRERRLPVSFITAGQRVPEDLERATPALLAGAMLREFPLRHGTHS